MAYITAQDVRDITAQDLTTSDISDSDLNDIINFAISQVNNDICTKITEEEVDYIDSYRKNLIDGSNTVYYVKSSFEWYLGDLNDDGTVDENDVIVWIYDGSSYTRSKATVSSVTEYGKITLSSAPSSTTDKITVTYRKCPVSVNTPDPLLKKACAELAASIAYGGIDAREKKRVSIEGFSISKDPQAERHYRKRYEQTIAQILSKEPMSKTEQEKFLREPEYYGTEKFV